MWYGNRRAITEFRNKIVLLNVVMINGMQPVCGNSVVLALGFLHMIDDIFHFVFHFCYCNRSALVSNHLLHAVHT